MLCNKDKLDLHLTVSEIEILIKFYRSELTKDIVRGDYRELIDLLVIFLGGDINRI